MYNLAAAILMVYKKESLNRFTAKNALAGIHTSKRYIFGINVRYNTTRKNKSGKVYSMLTTNNKTTVNGPLYFLVTGFVLYKADLP